ncbi:MAG: PilZ domain-containing protein [Syntrophomonas sp.]
MSSNFFTKGQDIRIELLSNQNKDKSLGTISGTVGRTYFNSFLIKIPGPDKKFPPFKVESPVNIFLGRNGSLYTSSSKVVDMELGPYSWMQLALPDKLRRIEMRHWVRIKANLNLRYRLARYNWPYYEASTLDISGGGLLFTAPHIVDEKLELELGIHMPDQRLVDSIVEVKRCEGYSTRWGNRYKIGCSFKEIGNGPRESLIKYVFNKQRDMLKRGHI